jgi:hypothetical protein
MRGVIASVLTIAMGTVSCGVTEPKGNVRVDVARSALGQLTFSFSRCDRADIDPRVSVLGVIEIHDQGGQLNRRDVCEVVASKDSRLGRSWTYGQTRSDVTVRGCEPLGTGTYIVSIDVRGDARGLGARKFTINRTGEVVQERDACR